MPKIRIFPSIAIVVAIVLQVFLRAEAQEGVPPAPGGPAAAPNALAPSNEPPTEAEKFLDEAIKKVSSLKSVIADVLEKVQMLGQKFEIQGKYRKAPNDRIYLKLSVSGMPDATGVMLQVCDGTTFWDFQQVFETKIFRRLDAAPILSKLRTADIGDDLRDQVLTQMGFAGPEVLLVGLRKTIKFDQKEKGTLDGRPVWILSGSWKSREGLLGPNSQPLPAMAPLPSYIPSLVKIYLGETDYWPYKVVLVGQPTSILVDTRPRGPDGRPIGPQSMIQKPLLTRVELIYSDVKLNEPVPEEEFAFQAPPGSAVEDETKKILDGLEQAVTMRAAQKKAEASKGEESILKEPLEIPKAPPAGDTPPPASPLPR